MSEQITQFRENLKRQIEVNKIGCCVGCGLTPEGLDQIISQALQKQRKEIIKLIKTPMSTEFEDPEEESADYSIEDFRARLLSTLTTK